MQIPSPSIPTLIRIGQPLALVGAIMNGIVAFALIRASPYDPSVIEFFAPRGLLFLRAIAVFTVYSAVALFFIYRGIKRRRSWARPLIVAFLVFWEAGDLLLAVVQGSSVALSSADLTPALILVAAVWYFYFKPNVTAYFASLRHPTETRAVA